MIKKQISSGKFTFKSVVLMICAVICCAKSGESGTAVSSKNMIKKIGSADELKKVMDSAGGKLLVIDLNADWCIPCRMLSPILYEIANELKDRAAFYQVDLDKNPEIARLFNVTGIPLVILIKDGAAVHAIQGLAPKSEYVRTINNFIDIPGAKNDAVPDGELVKGVRIIKLSPDAAPGDIYVFRGEEVKLIIEDTNSTYSIHIPEYKISSKGAAGKRLEVPFKAEKTGVFPVFCNGKCPSGDGAQFGRIIVMEFQAGDKSVYAEVDAAGAKKLIDDKKPVILDVRTPNEYYSGHIRDAILIPLQQLEERISELSSYKGREILVYCRSGNRSTVASEILQKHGYKKIYNLKSGIKGWIEAGYDTVK